MVIAWRLWERREVINPIDKLTNDFKMRLGKQGLPIAIWWGPERIEEEVSKIDLLKKEEIILACQLITKLRYQRKSNTGHIEDGKNLKLLRKLIINI